MIRLAAPMWLALGGAGFLAAVLWLLRRRWQRYPFPIEGRVEARRGLRFDDRTAGLPGRDHRAVRPPR